MTPYNIHRRVGGLDTLRAAAIAVVLMYHYGVVVSQDNTFGVLTQFGWAGVDLFFVLSGYLIGNKIFEAFASDHGFSFKTFMVRRLLRTLPNYYVILAIYFLLPSSLAGSSTASLWRFLTFTQNFGLHYGQTFTHSWSLCIEEQFYLLLPAVVTLVAVRRYTMRAMWWPIAAGILIGMVVRAVAWMNDGHATFSQEIYYSSFCRFDELLPGVGIALLRNCHAERFAGLLRHSNKLAALGFAGVVLTLYFTRDPWADTFVVTTFGFTVLALSFALLTLSALSPASMLNRVRVPGAASLALWSYAVYLAHKPIFKLMIAPLVHLHIAPKAPLGVSIIMVVSVFGGWVLYKLVEQPFMQLRPSESPAESTLDRRMSET